MLSARTSGDAADTYARMTTEQTSKPVGSGVEVDTARRNLLLGGLEDADLGHILPHLEAVDLPSGLELYSPQRPIEHVYFPLSGLCSLVARAAAGEVDV